MECRIANSTFVKSTQKGIGCKEACFHFFYASPVLSMCFARI